MAIIINASPGSATANSYATLADANTYFEGHVAGAAWALKTEDERNRALAQATRMLDAYVTWRGSRASTGQALAWPRSGLAYPDTGLSVASGVIPTELARATFEQARALLAANREDELAATQQGLEALTAGPVELRFRPGAAMPALAPAAWAQLARTAWGELRQTYGVGGAVPLARA